MQAPGAAALLPQLVCRSHQLPAQLEQSFRLEQGVGLLPHRYILGCPARLITAPCLEQMVAEMRMPVDRNWVSAVLMPQLQRASTVYLGYEESPGGDSHRLYFEYWDAVVQRLRATPAEVIAGWSQRERPLWEMGVGHKWQSCTGGPPSLDSAVGGAVHTTDYRVRPLLPQQEMLEQASAILRSAAVPDGLARRVLSLMQTIVRRAPEIDPVFLEVEEADSPRVSFDLCVHRHELRLSELEPWLNPVIRWFLGDAFGLNDCLPGFSPHGWITHLSAGSSRRGQPYCCVYYDQAADDVSTGNSCTDAHGH